MAYDRRPAAAVAEAFLQKRTRRSELIISRRNEVYAAVPELKELDDKIASVSFAIFRDVASGASPDDAAKRIEETTRALTDRRDALLKAHGYTRDFLDPPYDCPRCKDEGFLNNTYCDCFIKALSKAVFAESNLATLKGSTFDRFSLQWYSASSTKTHPVSPRKNMEKILSVCRNFADKFDAAHESLLFTGPSGLGKTFLSACIANELIARGRSVVYQSAGAVFGLLDRVKFDKSATPEDVYVANRLLDCDLLVLDDLGTEFITDFSASELFRLLNSRQLSDKKMIISTNLSVADLKKLYSERIISRLSGNFIILPFYGKDIRLLKKM